MQVEINSDTVFPVQDPLDDDPMVASVNDLTGMGFKEVAALVTPNGDYVWVLINGRWVVFGET